MSKLVKDQMLEDEMAKTKWERRCGMIPYGDMNKTRKKHLKNKQTNKQTNKQNKKQKSKKKKSKKKKNKQTSLTN